MTTTSTTRHLTLPFAAAVIHSFIHSADLFTVIETDTLHNHDNHTYSTYSNTFEAASTMRARTELTINKNNNNKMEKIIGIARAQSLVLFAATAFDEQPNRSRG